MKFLSLTFAALITLSVNAQLSAVGSFGYSNYFHGKTTAFQRNELQTSLSGGLAWKIGRKAGVKPALLYIQKGAKTDYLEDQQVKFRTDYYEMQVPAFVRLGFIDLLGGLYISHLAGKVGNYRWTLGEGDLTWDTDGWIYHKVDHGWMTGISIPINWISIDLKYTQGMRSVSKRDALVGWRNRTISGSLVVPFWQRVRKVKRSERAKKVHQETIKATIERIKY